LTKTKKKERGGKEKLMEKIRACVGKYKNIIVYKYENMRTNLMKSVKEEWAKDSK
jgi:mRNA turnover protein 4